jgi:hypothetical protein
MRCEVQRLELSRLPNAAAVLLSKWLAGEGDSQPHSHFVAALQVIDAVWVHEEFPSWFRYTYNAGAPAGR